MPLTKGIRNSWRWRGGWGINRHYFSDFEVFSSRFFAKKSMLNYYLYSGIKYSSYRIALKIWNEI